MENLEPLRLAITQLDSTIRLLDTRVATQDRATRAIYQTAAIKTFEYVYEIAVRLIRRRLERTADTPESVDVLDFRPLMRTAAEKGFIDDPVRWFLYREKRNITAHTYDETKAMDVITVLPEFLVSATLLLKALEGAHGAP